MRRLHLAFIETFWIRIAAFLVIMFLILLSDAVLSDFVPGYIQGVVGTPIKMGFVMALSSAVGIMMDLIFPQLLRGVGVRKLAGLAMIGSVTFLATLYVSTWTSTLLMILIGMAAWGIYYEFDAFMTKQFVADAAPYQARGAVWGVVGVFRNLAYFVGPLISTQLAVNGERSVILAAGTILIAAYIFFLMMKIPQKTEESGSLHGISVWEEIKHWMTLGKKVWPVIVISLLAGLVDAAFWTTGTVVNDQLALHSPLGGWFLSMYMLPSLAVGFVIAKWGIYKGKKRWAEIFLAVGGLLLMTITLIDEIWWILAVVLISSIFLGLAWPLVDATYSDYTARMGRGRKHMIGLSSSILSLAYVIGPILAGWAATSIGEIESFVWTGGLVFVVALILLVITPRKIRLPEAEIKTWE